MPKISQRELLEEGFWDKFKGLAKGAYQGVKEFAKVVAPKTSSQVGNIFQGSRDAFDRIDKAATPLLKRAMEWMDEQGRVMVPNQPLKIIKSFANGDKHLSGFVARKGVNKETGESVPGQKFKYPQAIVTYKKDKDQFAWVTNPRNDQLKRGADGKVEMWSFDAIVDPEDDKMAGYDETDAAEIKELEKLKRQAQLAKLRKKVAKNP